MTRLKIEYQSPSELRPRDNNPRTHTKKQIEKIAKSIQRFGFINPILMDEDGYVIAGHGRLEAAKLLCLTEVPIIPVKGMSLTDRRAYVIADNQLATLSGWSKDILTLEFAYLSEVEGFDPTLTGFDLPEIDAHLFAQEPQGRRASKDDLVPSLISAAVTRLGEIWIVGRHRLKCGDATCPKTYIHLFGDAKASMVFSDPPYNVKIQGHVSGLGKIHHREFVMASGEMGSFEFTSFLGRTFANCAKWSTNGSIHYHFADWRHQREMLDAGDANYNELKNLCMWVKSNGGMGSLYRSGHELVFVFKSGKAAHINNVELGKNGRFRTNVWSYPGVNSFGRTREDDLAMHPTVKPVALVMDAILDCSMPKDIIFDPFGGSGTTLVAAQRTGRTGYMIELDPLYCDVIVRRMQSRFRLTATLEGDGRSFDEIAAERASQPMEDGA